MFLFTEAAGADDKLGERRQRLAPPSMSAKIASNFGTMNTSKKPMIRMAIRAR